VIMAEVISSNDEQLVAPEIIRMALDQLGSGEHSIAAALATVAKEGTLEGADTAQFGNTVFLAQQGRGANKNKMVGRAFNVDTGRNYLNNCLGYLESLREKGITHYTTTFEGTEVLKLIQLLQRLVKNIDTDIYIGQTEDNDYVAYFKFGKDPLPQDV
jgi:hypothetical protein